MIGVDASLLAPLQNRVDGDQRAVLEDADLVRERMDFDHPAAGRVGNTVGIAADADHAFAGDAALQLQNRAESGERKRSQMRPFFGESLIDDA